ncbi:MAG: addiction module protein [Bacteroidetes bacterium]|nr:addiction module protein [Bacteroidota bacterium]
MDKSQIAELHKLPVEEKLQLVQELWDDIARDNSLESISKEHKEILDQRIAKINSGEATFRPWSEVKAKYKK